MSDVIKIYNEAKELHCTTGPAVIYPNGIQMYYENDERHNLEGPAIKWPDGNSNVDQYFIRGQQVLDKEEFEKAALKYKLTVGLEILST